MYIPYFVRSDPFSTRIYEIFYCLMGFYLLTYLMVTSKPESYESLGRMVPLCMDLSMFSVELARFVWSRTGGRRRGRRMPGDFWMWCRPQYEASIKETLGVEFILFAIGASGMLATHLSPARPLPKNGRFSDSQFDVHQCAFLFSTTRLIALTGTVCMANLKDFIIG